MRSPVQVWSAAPLKNTPLRVCFFNVCNVFCTHLHNFKEIVRGACRLRSMPFLASNPSSSLAVSSSLNIVYSRRNRRVFLMCAMSFKSFSGTLECISKINYQSQTKKHLSKCVFLVILLLKLFIILPVNNNTLLSHLYLLRTIEK